MPKLRIATRRSPLALWQAEYVGARLRTEHQGLEVELLPMTTRGDKLLDAPLAKVGGKGLFIKELERALFDARADIAVHSMKDVPVDIPEGLHIPVIAERGDPRDALVSPSGLGLDTLAPGARVGTSSLRRKCQLLNLRPDIEAVNARGGVHTRLSKLDDGQFDALILANAGLARLEMAWRITENLEPERMLPSIGQGALGVECRAGDGWVEGLIAPLNHRTSSIQNRAERAMSRQLEGSCEAPIAGYAELDDRGLHLRGLVARLDGQEILREQATGDPGSPEELGRKVGQALLDRGAQRLISGAHLE